MNLALLNGLNSKLRIIQRQSAAETKIRDKFLKRLFPTKTLLREAGHWKWLDNFASCFTGNFVSKICDTICDTI